MPECGAGAAESLREPAAFCPRSPEYSSGTVAGHPAAPPRRSRGLGARWMNCCLAIPDRAAGPSGLVRKIDQHDRVRVEWIRAELDEALGLSNRRAKAAESLAPAYDRAGREEPVQFRVVRHCDRCRVDEDRLGPPERERHADGTGGGNAARNDCDD